MPEESTVTPEERQAFNMVDAETTTNTPAINPQQAASEGTEQKKKFEILSAVVSKQSWDRAKNITKLMADSYNTQESDIHSIQGWNRALRGEITNEDAKRLYNPDALQQRRTLSLEEFDQEPNDVLHASMWGARHLYGALPYLGQMMKDSAVLGGVGLAGGAATGAVFGGTVGEVGLVTGPGAAVTIPAGAAGGAVMGGLGGGAQGVRLGMMKTGAEVAAGGMYRDLINQGADPDLARKSALAAGLVGGAAQAIFLGKGATQLIPINQPIKAQITKSLVQHASHAALTVGKSVAIMDIQKAAEYAITHFSAKYDEHITPPDFATMLKGFAQVTAQGALLGGTAEVVGHLINSIHVSEKGKEQGPVETAVRDILGIEPAKNVSKVNQIKLQGEIVKSEAKVAAAQKKLDEAKEQDAARKVKPDTEAPGPSKRTEKAELAVDNAKAAVQVLKDEHAITQAKYNISQALAKLGAAKVANKDVDVAEAELELEIEKLHALRPTSATKLIGGITKKEAAQAEAKTSLRGQIKQAYDDALQARLDLNEYKRSIGVTPFNENKATPEEKLWISTLENEAKSLKEKETQLRKQYEAEEVKKREESLTKLLSLVEKTDTKKVGGIACSQVSAEAAPIIGAYKWAIENPEEAIKLAEAPDVDPAPQDGRILYHGTSIKNAEAINKSGKLNPNKGKRHFAYSIFGKDTVYLTADTNTWLNHDWADSSRAMRYETAIQVKLANDAKLFQIHAEKDWEKLAAEIGYDQSMLDAQRKARQMDERFDTPGKLLQLDLIVDFDVPEGFEKSGRAIKAIKAAGYDGLYVTEEEHGAPQFAIFNTKKLSLNPDESIAASEVKQFIARQTAGYLNMDSEQLNALHSEIKKVFLEGKAEKAAKVQEFKANIKAKVITARKLALNGKTRREVKLSQTGNIVIKNSKRSAMYGDLSALTYNGLTDLVDFSGEFTKLVDINKEEDAEIDGRHLAYESYLEAVTKGDTKVLSDHERIRNDSRKIDWGDHTQITRTKDPLTGEITFEKEIVPLVESKDTMLKLALRFRDDTLRPRIENGNKLTYIDSPDLEGSISTQEVVERAITNGWNGETIPSAGKILEGAAEFYKEYGENRVQPHYTKKYGVPIKLIENYSGNAPATREDVENPTLLQPTRKAITPSSYHERVENSLPIQMETLTGGIQRHIAANEHEIAFGERAAELIAIFSDKEFRDILAERKPELPAALDVSYSYILGIKARQRHVSFQDISAYRRNLGTFLVAGKAVQFLKQWTAFAYYAHEMPIPDLVSGINDYFFHQKLADEVLSNSPFYRNRKEDLFAQAINETPSEFADNAVADSKAAQALMYPVQKGDISVIRAAGWAVFKYMYNNTKGTHQEKFDKALSEFARISKQTQSSSAPSQQTIQEIESPLGKMFGLFKKQGIQISQAHRKAIREWIADKKNPAKQYKAARAVLINIVAAVLFETVATAAAVTGDAAIKSIFGKKQEKFDAKKSALDIANKAISSPFSSNPLYGAMIQAIITNEAIHLEELAGLKGASKPFDPNFIPIEAQKNGISLAEDMHKMVADLVLKNDLPTVPEVTQTMFHAGKSVLPAVTKLPIPVVTSTARKLVGPPKKPKKPALFTLSE